MILFLIIEEFEVFRKVDGDTTTEITDTFFVNLFKKWFVFQDSGDPNIEIDDVVVNEGKTKYDGGLSERFSVHTTGKPIMMLSEVIEEVDRLVAYSVDFEVNPKFLVGGDEFEIVQNPDVTNDGDGFIKKIDGGALTDAGIGLTWTTLITDGQAFGTDVDAENNPVPLKIPGPLFSLAFGDPIQENFPSPFILFGKSDIS